MYRRNDIQNIKFLGTPESLQGQGVVEVMHLQWQVFSARASPALYLNQNLGLRQNQQVSGTRRLNSKLVKFLGELSGDKLGECFKTPAESIVPS